jgi:hypothetical protein
MEFTNPPQPWAMMYYQGHLADQLKKTTQDNAGGALEYYRVQISPQNPWVRQPGQALAVRQRLDDGHALVAVVLPAEGMLPKALSRQRRLKKIQVRDRKVPFAKEVKVRADGATTFASGKDWRGTHSSLSKDAAAAMATTEIKAKFPELISTLKLKGVSVRTRSTMDTAGVWRDSVCGYLVQFEVIQQGVPIWGDHVIVSIIGNEIDGISMLCHEEAADTDALASQKVDPIGPETALANGRDELKKALSIDGDYEILEASLCYLPKNTVHVPAWHFVINPKSTQEVTREMQHVWIDATTGKYLGKRKY